MIDFNILSILLFLNLDLNKEFNSNAIRASNNKTNLPFTNRVSLNGIPTNEEINHLNKFMNNNPYTIWVMQDSIEDRYLQDNSYNKVVSFPLMSADLTDITVNEIDKKIKIKKVKNDIDLEIWLKICTDTYKINIDEFRKYIQYLQSTASPESIILYLAFYEDEPVGTSLIINKDNLVGVHWVGVLPEFRKQGIGYAVTVFPLIEEESKGAKQAFLFSSTMGLSVYEKIGFKTITYCNVYKPSINTSN